MRPNLKGNNYSTVTNFRTALAVLIVTFQTIILKFVWNCFNIKEKLLQQELTSLSFTFPFLKSILWRFSFKDNRPTDWLNKRCFVANYAEWFLESTLYALRT